MITRYEAILAILSLILGMLSTLTVGIWKARGWVDNLAATDQRLATAIENLTKTTQDQHADNQRRLQRLEDRRRI